MTEDSPLEEWFPNLAAEGYTVTSPSTIFYNCYAWAAGDPTHWWEPGKVMSNYYWPPGVPNDYAVETYIQVFATLGYAICDSDTLEEGFEKVAIYSRSAGRATHAARQLPSGTWTSKLGDFEDIEHNTLAALEGDLYGSVSVVLKRPRSNDQP